TTRTASPSSSNGSYWGLRGNRPVPSKSLTLTRPTRGGGLLESTLARLRARKANSLLPAALRQGRILDVGCGSYPYFLSHTSFSEKFAIDQSRPDAPPPDVRWHELDLNAEPHLPFADEFFSAITMLAVAEHLDPTNLAQLFKEI